MTVLSEKLTFRISHSQSLKDKRQVAGSLINKARHKFNASISEVDHQDSHKLLVIGVAVVSGTSSHAQNMMDEIIRFMENNTDAELIETEPY